MQSSILCLSCLLATAAATALFPRDDGFIFQFSDARHVGYGTIPNNHGERMTMQFYDVDFASTNCTDVRVAVYNNGFVKNDQDLVTTLCDAKALEGFTSSSSAGFYVDITTSNNPHGQIKVRFSAPGGTKVIHELFQR